MSDKENREYRNTSTGNDSTFLINVLREHLSLESTLLLIGIGSGKDLSMLSKYYNVTGSDFSKLLLTVYQNSNPESDLITLDPVELETKRRFDSVFSNKALHQMKESDLNSSLKNQLKLLKSGGMAIHSFWSGNKEEDHHGLKWVYYTEESLSNVVPDEFEIIDIKTYKERIDHDSIYVLLKKKP
ncbi:MAG: class I SAM-dependent methyltransferase [Melioribacteraceae bacterium]|nr:class I SAM-dependent methyltransferase [Melioribacteraceae bacterium]